jgi:glc operon protein GlcG
MLCYEESLHCTVTRELEPSATCVITAHLPEQLELLTCLRSTFLVSAPEDAMNSTHRLLLTTVLLAPLAAIAADDKNRDTPATSAAGPLVTNERLQLNLAGAELILAAAKKKAVGMDLKLNLAVVDDGGHLIAFARMDGARPASGYTSITKAVTAATFRQETGPLPQKGEPDVLLNLSLQNAASASGGKVTTLKGGVPVVVNGQVIGGVGVGGGTGEQDAEVAKSGIEALMDALKKESK